MKNLIPVALWHINMGCNVAFSYAMFMSVDTNKILTIQAGNLSDYPHIQVVFIQETFLEIMFNIFQVFFMLLEDQIVEMRWTRHVAAVGEKRDTYRHLVGKLEGWWLLGRPRRSSEDGIKVDCKAVEWGDVVSVIWLRLGPSGRFW
jgi:hypothetical protein